MTETAQSSKRPLGIIFLTLFIDLMGFSIVFPLYPSMLDFYLPHTGAETTGLLGTLYAHLVDLAGATGHTADARHLTAVFFGGVLGSVYSVLQFLFAPLWGGLSDRYGRRTVLLITVGGIALSYLVWIFAANFWVFLFVRVFSGLCAGNISVASAAVADVTSRENRAKGMALVGIAFGLGFIFGPAIGGFTATIDLTQIAPGLAAYGIHPFTVPALVALLLALINLTLIWRLFPETKAEAEPAPAQEPRTALQQIGGFLHIRPPEVGRACLLSFLFMLSFTGLEFTFTFLANERFGYSSLQLGLVFVYIGFILILTQGYIVRRYGHKLGEKNLATAGVVIGGIAFATLAWSQSVGLFFTGITLFALSIGLLAPSTNALVSLYSPNDIQGRNLGLARAAGSLARAIGPILAAWLYFRYGSENAYLIAAAVMIPALLVALSLPKPFAEESPQE